MFMPSVLTGVERLFSDRERLNERKTIEFSVVFVCRHTTLFHLN